MSSGGDCPPCVGEREEEGERREEREERKERREEREKRREEREERKDRKERREEREERREVIHDAHMHAHTHTLWGPPPHTHTLTPPPHTHTFCFQTYTLLFPPSSCNPRNSRGTSSPDNLGPPSNDSTLSSARSLSSFWCLSWR